MRVAGQLTPRTTITAFICNGMWQMTDKNGDTVDTFTVQHLRRRTNPKSQAVTRSTMTVRIVRGSDRYQGHRRNGNDF